MSKLTDVLDFMSTLTKSEKRYVTLKVNEEKDHHKKKYYLDLFHLLTPLLKEGEKTQTQLHNEAELLKQKHKKTKVFSTVTVLKLQDFLMGCLRQFNADKPEFKLEQMIQNIRILHQKGLYEQARALIKKVKKEVVDRYENEWKTFEVIQLERRTYLAMRQPDHAPLAKLQQDSRDQLKKMTIILDSTEDYENMLYRLRGHHFSAGLDLSITGKALKEEINAAKDLPFEASLQALAALSNYYIYVEPNAEKGLRYIQKLIELFEDHKYRKNRYPENYVQALVMSFNRAVQADNVKAFAPTIQKIKSLLDEDGELFPSAKPERNQVELSKGALMQYRLLGIMLHYYNYKWQDKEATKTINNAVLLLKRKPNIPDSLLITLYFNLASYFLLAEQYKDSQLFLDHIFNYYEQRGKHLRKDAIFQANILEAVLLFEQAQTDTEKEQLEQKLGQLMTTISEQKGEAIKTRARNFISRLHLLLFETDSAIRQNTFKSMLKVLPRKDAAQYGFISFRLWMEKKAEND